MKQYQPKPVEAVRWMKDDDYPMTRIIAPELQYARGGKHYYLSHKDVNATEWFPVDPQAGGQDGQYLPFAFWSVNTGERIPLNWDTLHTDLTAEQMVHFQRAIAIARQKNPELNNRALLPYGVLEFRKEDGSYENSALVQRGDWIVRDARGKIAVIPHLIFEQMYSELPAVDEQHF